MRRLFLFFILIVSSLSFPAMASEPEEWVFVERGANFERRKKGNTYSWESAPQWVWNGVEYRPYIYEETQGSYEVRSGLIGARIYKSGYAEFWNPSMTEIRLYEEVWELEYYDKGRWKVCDLYSPIFFIESDSDMINITASFLTDYPNNGERAFDIKYIFREGLELKHEVEFTYYGFGEYQFRVLQKWAGIVGTRVRYSGGSGVVSSPLTVNSSFFLFEKDDGSLSLLENQYGAIEYLEPVVIDVHAQGMKADFVFSNWTLNWGEQLEIDPATSSIVTTEDAYMVQNSPNNNFGAAGQLIVNIRSLGNRYIRSITKFDISSLPAGASVSLSEFRAYCRYIPGSDPPKTNVQARKMSNDSWAEMSVTWNNVPAYGDVVDTVEPIVNTWMNWTVTTYVQEELAGNEIVTVFLRAVTEGSSDDEGSNYWDRTHATLKPYLYIEYTVPVDYDRFVTQGLSGAYGVVRVWDALRDVTQSLSGVYAVVREIAFGRDVTQGLTGVYEVAREIGFLRAVTQALTSVYGVTRDIAQERAVTQALTGVFSVSRSTVMSRAVTQGITSAYSVAIDTGFFRAVTQGLSSVFGVTRSVTQTRGVTQSMSTDFEGWGWIPVPGGGLNFTGEWTWYNLTSVNTSFGVVDAGDVNSTFVKGDGDIYNVSEVGGVPGMDVMLNWTGVDPSSNSLWISIWGLYDGNQAHQFDIEILNYTGSSWVNLGVIEDGVVFQWYNTSIYALRIPTDFISGGNVTGRLHHISPGNPAHDLFLDYINLVAFVPFEELEGGGGFGAGLMFLLIPLGLLGVVLLWRAGGRY